MPFIVLEGLDGSGKSTVFTALCEHLRTRYPDAEIIKTREPGGTELGEQLRTLILQTDMDPVTELMLVSAQRAEHVQQVIRPALKRGAFVMCDRFTASTYAYQVKGRGLPESLYLTLTQLVCGTTQPDLTVLLDLDPKVAAERIASRAAAPDRFDSASAEFISRVRQAYLNLSWRHASKYAVVNAEADYATVIDRALSALDTWIDTR
mgnify:CR=1 FL=1